MTLDSSANHYATQTTIRLCGYLIICCLSIQLCRIMFSAKTNISPRFTYTTSTHDLVPSRMPPCPDLTRALPPYFGLPHHVPSARQGLLCLSLSPSPVLCRSCAWSRVLSDRYNSRHNRRVSTVSSSFAVDGRQAPSMVILYQP